MYIGPILEGPYPSRFTNLYKAMEKVTALWTNLARFHKNTGI